MDDTNLTEAFTYSSKEPDVLALSQNYERTVSDLDSYIVDICKTSTDEHHNIWAGKTSDLRKHGADAFPWEGASDLEALTIKERMHRLVALLMTAMNRSNVQASPVGVEDGPRAAQVAKFVKWMITSGYISRFKPSMELAASYMLERGIAITHVGWNAEDRVYNQEVTLEALAQVQPELIEMIKSGQDDDELVILTRQMFPNIKTSAAKAAIKSLRETGKGDFPIIKRQVNEPTVNTLSPDGDFFFPAFATDPQRAPYCFWRRHYTLQELENRTITDGWDSKFVDYVIEHYNGLNEQSVEGVYNGSNSSSNGLSSVETDTDGLVEIIHVYRRLVDPETKAEGIYETIIHKSFTEKRKGAKPYALHRLLNGYVDYPVEVTKLYEKSSRLYDVETIPLLLRGLQWQVKLERDSRVDRNSMATLPPLMHKFGQAPDDYGPGRLVPYRTKGDIDFGPTPAFNNGSVEMENTMEDQANKLVGLDMDNPLSQTQRQYIVDKYLDHVGRVTYRAFEMFQRFGPDEMYFRVTGSPDPVQFNKGNPDENYDVMVSYDVQNSDPESVEKKLNQMASLLQMDRNGTLDPDAFIAIAAASIDPVLADKMLQPSKEAQNKLTSMVMDDLSKIYSGIERPAMQNGAQVAMQIVDQYANQPDIMQKLMEDEAFKERLGKYRQQYEFQMQQAQNAQIGKIGTAPAQMGGTQTQGLKQ